MTDSRENHLDLPTSETDKHIGFGIGLVGLAWFFREMLPIWLRRPDKNEEPVQPRDVREELRIRFTTLDGKLDHLTRVFEEFQVEEHRVHQEIMQEVRDAFRSLRENR